MQGEKQDTEDAGPVSVPCCTVLRQKSNQLIENKKRIRSRPHPPQVWSGELSLPGVPSVTPLPCPHSQSPPGVQAHHLLPLSLSSCNREERFLFYYKLITKGMLPMNLNYP